MTDNLMDLADSLGFQDHVAAEKLRRPARAEVGAAAVTGEPPATPPVVAADSEGRTGGAELAPGAVPFTLPKPPPFSTGRGRVYDALPKLR